MLRSLGVFSDFELQLFNQNIEVKTVEKNEILLSEGEISKSIFFIKAGALFQVQKIDDEEKIIDLNIQNDWVFSFDSLTNQIPSNTMIKAFAKSEIVELNLENLHKLISISQNFLQLNKIFNSLSAKIHIYDSNLNPSEKYNYLLNNKPQIIKIFPLNMIASYLKMRQETLSRVRANVFF
ncbi:Crp/Fnr family transcriptional regulator [Epilithonimonas hungarica]|uniref:cAMP-binding domain of CRP or a regulatory subunit of cAMP-dependent protein kinases n=1 Tax=Epilithonimonas hungarica TaxID=454006 RepID=A0A1G7JUW6_9FLAO|nr:cyclic nucleotide-binding domain-containing protein [Epilithonimonas hungarica]SDF28249.1 cAMP-binding domain of CRP or a regulatory subunit of cAMP-dependent protein kinases [Epilithonimonas hungarica]